MGVGGGDGEGMGGGEIPHFDAAILKFVEIRS